MAKKLIKKYVFFAPYDDVDNEVDDFDDENVDDDDVGDDSFGEGGFRVLACADTLARTPLGVRQYSPSF